MDTYDGTQMEQTRTLKAQILVKYLLLVEAANL